MAKAPQMGEKGLKMVKSVVKMKVEHRASVSAVARAVRKAPASKAVRTARFQPFQCIQRDEGDWDTLAALVTPAPYP